jgi:hypothetical protein
MATLTTQDISSKGLSTILSAASAGGDSLINGTKVFLLIENDSGTQLTITIAVTKLSTTREGFGKLTKSDSVFVIQDAQKGYIGPFAKAYEDDVGKVSFSYSNEIGISIAAVHLPTASVAATKTFCTFDEAFNFDNGGAQTVSVGSGFVLTTSLGNIADSIQVQATPFSGTTGTTKAEAQYISKSGVSTDESGGVGYVDDSDGSTASVICGVIFLPDIGGGTLLDAQTQLPVETGVTMNPEDYFCWTNFDLTGSATYEDSEGNTGALSVLVSYTAGDDIFKATICNAGSTITDTMAIGYNFGTKEYFDGTGNGYCEV